MIHNPIEIEVQACKYDGRVHRRWHAHLRAHGDTLLILDAVFDEEVNHPLLGHIGRGTISTEYYWTNRFYNIFRFADPDGVLRNFYCNIATPARLENGTLRFIDLDIDVLVHPDLSYEILDEEEFAAHVELFGYTPDIIENTRRAQIELIAMIEQRDFPFSDEVV